MAAGLIRLAHGSGGLLTQELVHSLFVRTLGDEELSRLLDAAVLDHSSALQAGSRLAMTTDAYVVDPLEFPGGDIGKLAVCGTVNDLAATAAQPLWMSAAWILEEGLEIERLRRLVFSMKEAAAEAGIRLVTGDTKVVPHGLAGGAYIGAAGVGIIPPGRDVGPHRIQPGDAILVNGTLGDHGMAIMLLREGISMDTPIESDCAPLNGLVEALFEVGISVHCLRDATRGGVGAVLCELALQSGLGMIVHEEALPVREAVAAACEILGLDPLFVANEGKMVAFLPASEAERALAVWRAHPYGRGAALIGEVAPGKPIVRLRTTIGSERQVRLPAGELLPRIC
jgi:hydrogenase expression/formation protein HypE